MASKSSPWRTVMVWVAVGLVLVLIFVAAVFRVPLLAAAGLERSGAPSTVPPTLFDLPTPEETPPQVAAAVGPVGAASVAPEGTLPDRAVLEQRITGIDIAALETGVPDDGSLVLAYQVLDAATGQVLAEANPDRLLIPASNTKLLTATAVLSAYEATDTFDTTVVMPEPGQIVLVGGGDPLLASAETPGRASLENLAAKTAETLSAQGITSVTLGYDASLFQESWAATWPASYQDQVTPISALWADEGRDSSGARSATPAVDAAALFATYLTNTGITVEGAPTEATGSGQEMARVSSPRVHELAEAAMLPSNNSYTEVLGMQVAVKLGQPTTFAGSTAAIQQQLTSLGLWRDGAVIYDASGLSRENQLTAGLLAGIARYIVVTPEMTVVQDGYPVAGISGSLADRYTDEISMPARGVARGKTGTLSLVASLAGTTVTADGREVAFAFITNGSTDGWAARVWADQAVGIVTSCGC